MYFINGYFLAYKDRDGYVIPLHKDHLDIIVDKTKAEQALNDTKAMLLEKLNGKIKSNIFGKKIIKSELNEYEKFVTRQIINTIHIKNIRGTW
ncbi:hypothetical protein KNT64_gp031 [Pseudomonas phage PspYZU05]|uniref:Uncharacterized protein n=1 Tax=Pseudomonas phage PspYZU05 TaxID=1983556 RepID=A0A2U7N881_9CAUD|nr:hypothetical protein KNT64_gp031 [Pseudomonas phage PspYZU05]ASD51983.1 hypothetical protein PspYZU05_31 [Pseudomonas phage PspYZU05]